MSWLAPAISSRNGIIQRYILNITELNTGSRFQLNTAELFLIVNDLRPFYQYSIIVAAETVGVGPFSSPVIIELPEDGKIVTLHTYPIHIPSSRVHTLFTAPTSPPREVSFSTVTSTTFTLSWIEPPSADQNGLIRQYQINITEVDTQMEFTYSVMTTEFTVEFLHPYYCYTCSVTAVTISAGPYSNALTICTEIDSK